MASDRVILTFQCDREVARLLRVLSATFNQSRSALIRAAIKSALSVPLDADLGGGVGQPVVFDTDEGGADGDK